MSAHRFQLGLFLVLAVIAIGCSRNLPRDRSAAFLYRDLQRIVTLTETAGWEIDRLEVEEALPAVLMSVCRVRPEQRSLLLQWVDEQIVTLGGPVKHAWQKRGRKLGKVDDLLEMSRVRLVLAHAIEVADEDCPFWIEPSEKFRGRQVTDDRWLLSFGGGGKGILWRRAGHYDINFGGAGRLMLGRAVGDRWTLLGGSEFGASASFPKDGDGSRGSLQLGFDAVLPLAMRYRFVNSYVEFESGYLMHFTEDDTDVVPGFKIGVSFGGRASRRRWFFPGAVFGVSYERTFSDTVQGEVLHLFKFGFRAAVDIPL